MVPSRARGRRLEQRGSWSRLPSRQPQRGSVVGARHITGRSSFSKYGTLRPGPTRSASRRALPKGRALLFAGGEGAAWLVVDLTSRGAVTRASAAAPRRRRSLSSSPRMAPLAGLGYHRAMSNHIERVRRYLELETSTLMLAGERSRVLDHNVSRGVRS